jgi:hypothetical protein
MGGKCRVRCDVMTTWVAQIGRYGIKNAKGDLWVLKRKLMMLRVSKTIITSPFYV